MFISPYFGYMRERSVFGYNFIFNNFKITLQPHPPTSLVFITDPLLYSLDSDTQAGRQGFGAELVPLLTARTEQSESSTSKVKMNTYSTHHRHKSHGTK
jgi:hypothetical protein